MKVIPVRLKDHELKQIDRLVELGVFQNRIDAIRELIRLGIENLNYLGEISEPLLGVFALEALGLAVDPSTGEVKPTRGFIARA